MTQVGVNYAGGLYALAQEEGLTGQLLEHLEVLETVFANEPQFMRLLAAPNIPKQERCQAADRALRGRVHPYVLNFVKLLTEKGYAKYFGDCCRAYRERYDADNGILRVSAVSAVPLTQEQTGRLAEKLSQITQKTVVLTQRTDPSCLGGVKLTYDGKQIDGTVRSRLDSLSARLKNTVL